MARVIDITLNSVREIEEEVSSFDKKMSWVGGWKNKKSAQGSEKQEMNNGNSSLSHPSPPTATDAPPDIWPARPLPWPRYWQPMRSVRRPSPSAVGWPLGHSWGPPDCSTSPSWRRPQS